MNFKWLAGCRTCKQRMQTRRSDWDGPLPPKCRYCGSRKTHLVTGLTSAEKAAEIADHVQRKKDRKAKWIEDT